mgnify:CR=1 FL=1
MGREVVEQKGIDKIIDLRIEDNPDPVRELRSLVRLNRAYHLMNEGARFVDFAFGVAGSVDSGTDTSLFQGYFENPDANDSKYRDGVYHSGDLGHVLVRDGRRYLYFDGRTDDWISKDGENFSAAQVARLLSEHDDVVLAAAYLVYRTSVEVVELTHARTFVLGGSTAGTFSTMFRGVGAYVTMALLPARSDYDWYLDPSTTLLRPSSCWCSSTSASPRSGEPCSPRATTSCWGRSWIRRMRCSRRRRPSRSRKPTRPGRPNLPG